MTRRMKAADLHGLQNGSQRGRNRRVRGALRVTVDGMTFDSKAEAERWAQLRLLEQAGEIAELRRQVPIGLEGRDGPILTDSRKRQRTYVADFVYFDCALGVTVIEDRKGYPTEVFKLKRAILEAQGVRLRIT